MTKDELLENLRELFEEELQERRVILALYEILDYIDDAQVDETVLDLIDA